MTWLSFCARRPGPEWKTGYPSVPSRTLGEIEGVVDHSMEGPLAAAYGVLDGPAQSSWTFSIPKVGEPIQHYSLEKIPWHAGLPGDRRQDTSLIGNLTLGGKEHEGVAGEPWTENQLFWSAKIDVAMRALCPAFGANPPTLRLNMWEHNWLSATSCPSGRNPWGAKFARINELEDDMPLNTEDKIWIKAKLDAQKADILKEVEDTIVQYRGWQLVKGSSDTVYLVTQGRKRHLFSGEAYKASGYKGLPIETLSDAELAKIPSA